MALRKKFTRADLTEKEAQTFDLWEESGFGRLALTRAIEKVYGYAPTTASQHACRLLRSAVWKDAIEEASLMNLHVLAPSASRVLEDMMETGMIHGKPIKPELIFKVAKEIHDRAHGSSVARSRIEVEDVTDRPAIELRREIADMLKTLPEADRKTFLAAAGVSMDVIDVEAEPVIVDPEAPWGWNPKTGEPYKDPGANRRGSKRRLPGPDAYRPPQDSMSPVERRIAALKAKRAKEIARMSDNVPGADDE